MKTRTLATICLVGVAGVGFAGCAIDPEASPEESLAEKSNQLVRPAVDDKHCVIPTSAVKVGEASKALPPAGSPRCFATFTEAIDFATQGRVKLDANATPEDLDEAALSTASIGSAAVFVIGVEYEHFYFGGATNTFTSSVSCSGYIHSVSSMQAGWDNVVSSARAYSLCNHSYHYENPNFGGASVDCGAECSYIGDAMNDRTSSLRWSE